MRTLPSIIALCLACGYPASAHAAQLEGFWETSLPVSDRNDQQRRIALPSLLHIMILKAVGDRQAINGSWLHPLLADAEKYLSAYRYRNRPAPLGQEETITELVASFNPALLKPALEGSGAVLWGQQRPSILPWVLSSPQQEPQTLLGMDTPDWQVGLMRETGRARGMNVIIPLQDLTDQGAISAIDIRGNWQERIASASERYGAQGIWYGSVDQVGEGLWQASWTLMLGDQAKEWQDDGTSEEELLRQGMHEAMDLAARHYLGLAAANATDAGSFRIRIGGISNLKRQREVFDHLRRLDRVERVRVKALNADQVDYLLHSSNRAFVLENIALQELLRPVSMDDDSLEYHYQGLLDAN